MNGIRQHYKYDCGAAALAYVASCYGIKASLAHIRILCGCSPDGISIQGIIDGARKLGLKAKGYKSADKDISSLIGTQAPMIAHIINEENYSHYVTIFDIKKDKLSVMDPATGKTGRKTHKEFTRNWTGYIIAVVPDGTSGNIAAKESPFIQHLLALFKTSFKEIAFAFAGSLACTFAGISTSFLLQQLIDTVVPQKDEAAMIALGALVSIIMVLALYAGWRTTRYLIRCSLKTETALTARYIEKIFRMPAEFFGNYQTGDIASRRDDIHNIRAFITDGTIGILSSIFTVTGALVAMFLYNPRLTMYIAVFIPAYYGLYRLSGHISKKYSRQIAAANAAFESDMLESISNITGIRHYNAHRLSTGKIEGSLVMLTEKMNLSAGALNLFETLAQGVSKTLVCLILTIGAASVLNGSMSIGELIGFYTLCTFFTVPLNTLIETSEKISRTSVSFNRMFEIIDLPDESSRNTGISPCGITGDLTATSLHFRFAGREELLKGTSFVIPHGKMTVIRGESGCGKSTIAKLILGEYVPDSGSICYGETNISQLNLQQWRQITGYVPQDINLFNASILDNITLKEEDPDIEKVLKICVSLGMEGMLQRMPQGLLTPVGKRGNGLSGGECQKIWIARALYKDPQIYIFDEATSALDPESEKCVLNVLAALKEKGKTIVFISHKEMCLKIADNVVTIN